MSAAPSTILLVDDNDEMRAFLRAHLADHCRVREAADGEEAWACIQDECPDLVITDTEMDGLGGRGLCRRLGEESGVPSIPVVLMASTPDVSVEELPRAKEVIAKPFTPNELEQRVKRYLPARSLPEYATTDQAGTFLKEAVRVVERQLHDPSFMVEDLADALSMSRRHLTRRLKEAADMTPAVLIRDRRIERAKAQLEGDPDTVQEVGRAVGFRSASHFSQVFREQVGCSPSIYKARHAG